jgi:general stress protein YciG
MPNKDQGHTGGNRGFASMSEEQQREIASKGGKAAHEKGTAHEFSHEEAVEAGRKGGQASHGGKSESGDESTSGGGQGFGSMSKEQQREAARKGGEHSHGNK